MYNYIWTLNSMFAHDMFPTRYVKGRVKGENYGEVLEKLFELMNTGGQPPEYRSMSVGDFITLIWEDSSATFVCCNTGWQPLPIAEMA